MKVRKTNICRICGHHANYCTCNGQPTSVSNFKKRRKRRITRCKICGRAMGNSKNKVDGKPVHKICVKRNLQR